MFLVFFPHSAWNSKVRLSGQLHHFFLSSQEGLTNAEPQRDKDAQTHRDHLLTLVSRRLKGVRCFQYRSGCCWCLLSDCNWWRRIPIFPRPGFDSVMAGFSMCLRSLGSGFDHSPVVKDITTEGFWKTMLDTPVLVMQKVVFIIETLNFLSVTPAQWNLAREEPSSVRNAVRNQC